MSQTFLDTFFSASDLISFFGWLFIISLIAHIIYAKNKKKEHYKYFLGHFYWKMLMSISFALVYLIYYGGGDTTAYWEGAVKLNDLFFYSPGDYFNEMFSTPSQGYLPPYFTRYGVGRPPVWIYYDPNSWFVSKIGSIFSFFAFKSYLTLNLFFGVLSTIASWKFFQFVIAYTKLNLRDLAIACLFIPTVGFWCSCIMKDTLVYIGILAGTIGLIRMLHKQTRWSVSTLLSVSLSVFLLLPTRSFVLLTILVAIMMVIVFQINKSRGTIIVVATRIIGLGVALAAINFYLMSSDSLGELGVQNLLENAETTQNDFKYNETYTGKKYDLGEIEFTSTGMLKVAPAAIGTALFRPFIWEMGNPFMLLNGLENLIISYFFLTYIFKLYKEKSFKRILSNHLFFYSLILVLILGFFVGLTSGLFGILVRMKAPILVFFVLLLASQEKGTKQKLNEKY
jgi:hypothetical protein